jgi:Zn finger protein HypA/HybF involved in hydrogenase expression
MHEFGIAQQIVDVAVQRATGAGANRITEVLVELGEESGVAQASLELYWPQVTRSTCADGARLAIQVAEDPLSCRVVAIDVVDAGVGSIDPAARSTDPVGG